MGDVKTIVAGLDMEDVSEAVLGRAIQLATEHEARLVVVHVIETPSLSQAASASASDLSESALRDHLNRQARAAISNLLAQGGSPSADVEVAFGSAHTVITGVAGERGADFVVIGPGRGHSLSEKVLGSTADRVVRASPAPVLVVRNPSAGPYRRVAVAVDFSPQSAAAAKDARKLAPAARMDLVHALYIPLTFEQAMLRAGTSQADIGAYRSAKEDRARHDLSLFVRDVIGTGKVATHFLDCEPGPALVRLAKSRDIDLLALGPNGRGVVLQALLGSVTQRVLREAACDVLVATMPG